LDETSAGNSGSAKAFAPADKPARLDILGQCLRLNSTIEAPASLRDEIVALGWDALLGLADELRLTSALTAAIEAKGLAPAIPKLTLPDGRMTITAALAKRGEDHLRSREAFCSRCDELVMALNAAQIEPILIKGGRSLWLGTPAWRSLRDIDLLVPGREAVSAQAIALSLGYEAGSEPEERKGWHHFDNLFRPDMPGWIEIHRRGGVPRAEQFISTVELVASATAVALPGRGTARVLPAHLHILHSMVHHHIGHRGDRYGLIDLKGLFEFAAECAELGPDERTLLMARAARHPRLLAITELWIAASARFFGMPIEPPLVVQPDAVRWWDHVSARLETPFNELVRNAGVAEERTAAGHLERLRRAPYGNTAIGRQFWRLAIAASFVQRISLS
jgi:hypothetical protein